MKAEDNFLKTEESIIYEYNRDGSIETFGGFYLLLIGTIIAIWRGNVLLQLVAVVATILPSFFLLRLWRKRITYPRLGYVQSIARSRSKTMSPARGKFMLRNLLLNLIFAFAFELTWEFLWKWGVQPGELSPTKQGFVGLAHGPFAVLIGTYLAMWGLYSGLNRFWIISCLAILGLVALAAFYHIYPSWVMAPIGLFLIGIGIARVRRFVHENPVMEAADVRAE